MTDMKLHFREYRKFIPANSSILDIGTGTGYTLNYINKRIPNLRVHGLDIVNHLDFPTSLDRTIYDGVTIPFSANSFDTVLLFYTLRHTQQPKHVLSEAARVSRNRIIIIEEFEESVKNHRPKKSKEKQNNHAIGLSLGEDDYLHKFTQASFEVFFDKQFNITKHMILPTTTDGKLLKHLYILKISNH